MCLRTKMTEPAIAEKDITCYKVIRKDMSSYYYNDFKWEFGKTYHSWIEVVDHRVVDRNNKGCNFKEIHQGFHSYETLEGLKRAYFSATVPCIAVKCTIPSGSKVYKGSHNCVEGYASDQLIINEVIDAKELYSDFDWDNYPYKEGQVIQVTMPHHKFWYDIIFGGEQVKFHNKNWEDYQITNIQPNPLNNTHVDLLIENCKTLASIYISTDFDGVNWVADNEVRLKENKEE